MSNASSISNNALGAARNNAPINTSFDELYAEAIQSYGNVMKSRVVADYLDITLQTLLKIPREDLPRSEPRGRAGSSFLTRDVVRYLYRDVYGKEAA